MCACDRNVLGMQATRELNKAKGVVRKLDYQTNNAKLSMMQERAHLKVTIPLDGSAQSISFALSPIEF